jgi:hypothetical protein
MNKRLAVLLVLGLGALLVASAAQAKGPSEARITGPGLDGGITLEGNGEQAGSRLYDLTGGAGFFAAAFGQSPDPMLPSRPKGALGPKYSIVWTVPTGSGNDRIRQDIYPYAKPYPVTYMPAGQTIFDQETRGGWYLASLDTKTTLVRAGLPARAPLNEPSSAGFPTLPVALAAAALLALGGLAAAYRRGLVTIGWWRQSR